MQRAMGQSDRNSLENFWNQNTGHGGRIALVTVVNLHQPREPKQCKMFATETLVLKY